MNEWKQIQENMSRHAEWDNLERENKLELSNLFERYKNFIMWIIPKGNKY